MMDVSGKGKVLIALGLLCIFFLTVSYKSALGTPALPLPTGLSSKAPVSAPCIPTTKTVTKVVTKNVPAGRHIPTKPIPPFKTRFELAGILNREGLTTGVELGVQRGGFAKHNLRNWPSCKRYVLVDLWAHQANYRDSANFGTAVHQSFKREALHNVAPYVSKGIVEVCQGYTTECAKRYANNTFDFIYVDARHDYKGVLQDLEVWYPLLKPGGIFAGHDYVTQNDGPKQGGQDWTINYDGTRDATGRAVKGAVDDFSVKNNLQLTVSYREGGWNTWAARKPY